MNEVSLKLTERTGSIPFYQTANELLSLYYKKFPLEIDNRSGLLYDTFSLINELFDIVGYNPDRENRILLANYIYRLKGSVNSITELCKFCNININKFEYIYYLRGNNKIITDNINIFEYSPLNIGHPTEIYKKTDNVDFTNINFWLDKYFPNAGWIGDYYDLKNREVLQVVTTTPTYNGEDDSTPDWIKSNNYIENPQEENNSWGEKIFTVNNTTLRVPRGKYKVFYLNSSTIEFDKEECVSTEKDVDGNIIKNTELKKHSKVFSGRKVVYYEYIYDSSGVNIGTEEDPVSIIYECKEEDTQTLFEYVYYIKPIKNYTYITGKDKIKINIGGVLTDYNNIAIDTDNSIHKTTKEIELIDKEHLEEDIKDSDVSIKNIYNYIENITNSKFTITVSSKVTEEDTDESLLAQKLIRNCQIVNKENIFSTEENVNSYIDGRRVVVSGDNLTSKTITENIIKSSLLLDSRDFYLEISNINILDYTHFQKLMKELIQELLLVNNISSKNGFNGIYVNVITYPVSINEKISLYNTSRQISNSIPTEYISNGKTIWRPKYYQDQE